MGSWSVLSVTGRNAPLDTATEYGTIRYVTFRLHYRTSVLGAFVEPPKMAWDEIIMFNDYAKKECWSFSSNFYTQNPDSPTMAVWAQRYFRAYVHAHNTPYRDSYGKQKGHSKLFTNLNAAVTGAQLSTHQEEAKENEAVQDDLERHGGILEIEVHDIPNIISSSPGVKTSGLKVFANPTPRRDLLPTGGIWYSSRWPSRAVATTRINSASAMVPVRLGRRTFVR